MQLNIYIQHPLKLNFNLVGPMWVLQYRISVMQHKHLDILLTIERYYQMHGIIKNHSHLYEHPSGA